MTHSSCPDPSLWFNSPMASSPPPPTAPKPQLAPATAAVLTFLAAGCVLVLEIAAGRLLAPYVGVSLTTYTGIIGVILAGISLGAWLGGRAADRWSPVRLIGPTLVAGGLTAIASVPIVANVGEVGIGQDLIAIVTLAAAGFVIPATVLSAVAPMIVRASIVSIGTSGSTVGRLSAIGTAGAIVGTFLTGFVLLGLLPTRVLIVGTGALLVLLGLLVALVHGGRGGGAILAAIAVVTLAGAMTTPTLCDRESAYYCIRMVTDPGNPNGRTLVLDGLRHAHVDLGDPLDQQFRYLRWFTDAVSGPITAAAGDVDVVHVGGGGFSFPRFLAATWPASRHTVLELDPVILATAKAEMGFSETDRIRVVVGDARLSLRSVATDSQAVAVGDAFGGLSVPWHLTTREFLAEVDRVLTPDGRYVMNLIDGPALRFTRAEAATLRSVFGHVVVIATRSSLSGDSGGNVVVVASQADLDAGAIRLALDARGDLDAQLVGGGDFVNFIDGAPLLTDDMAPVDLLIGR